MLVYVLEKIQSNIDNGKVLRSDDFFSSEIDARSSADEILEAGMLAAQKEYEEKKLKFYANLIANIAFNTTFSKAEANHLIKTAQTLSWRQLCILSLAERKDSYELKNKNYLGQEIFNQELTFLLQEIYDLYVKNLIYFGEFAIINTVGIHPSKLAIEGVGAHLNNLMNLSEIPDSEIEGIANLLA